MKKTKESGQVLLIVIMLIAVALTTVLTMSFTSRTDTQIAKLEEENQKALAAAEAGIEAALKGGDVPDISTLGFSGFTGSAKVITASDSTDYSTPIKKDQSYTFYLGNYSGGAISSPSINSIRIYFEPDVASGSCNNFAFEVSIISGACGSSSDCSIHRYLIDKGGNFTATAGGDPDKTDERDVTSSETGYTVADKIYKCQSDIISISQAAPDKIMMVKFLSPTGISQTEIAFRGSGNLPPQATTVTSNAKTSTGARKEVELIQYYPQIPTEIFDTIF